MIKAASDVRRNGVIDNTSNSDANDVQENSTSRSFTRFGLPVRRRLPVEQPNRSAINLWAHLKKCVGKELTKITMPVTWNEPLSLLQRISEYMNYAYLLKSAALCQTPEERTLKITTFAISALSSNLGRLNKPFNPLLGETYELWRSDFRILCEQVGHHPPVSAFYADNPQQDYIYQGSVYPKLKFWGKSLEFQPKGVLTVNLPAWNETYKWSNVSCIINNIIFGSIWMEHQGTMKVTNEKSGHYCVITFRPGGWFSGDDDLHSVEGFLLENGNKLLFIYGRWTEFLCSVDIVSFEEYFGVKSSTLNDAASDLPKHPTLSSLSIPNSRLLWRADPRPTDSDRYYNFSAFAMGLNEIESGMMDGRSLCPSDCRLRPDLRALEDGNLELAIQEKERLENKQRQYRAGFKGKKECDWWKPKWFRKDGKEGEWTYCGKYWENKWPSGDTSDDSTVYNIY